MKRGLLIFLLSVLLIFLSYKDINTGLDVMLFWLGALVLVCVILALTITSYAKTEDNNRLNKHK